MKDELAKLIQQKYQEEREHLAIPGTIAGADTQGTLIAQTFALRGHDTVMKMGFDLPMEPLALADQLGLDEVLNSLQVLFHALGDHKYRPRPMSKKMVWAGNLGVKTGKDFLPIRPRNPIPRIGRSRHVPLLPGSGESAGSCKYLS